VSVIKADASIYDCLLRVIFLTNGVLQTVSFCRAYSVAAPLTWNQLAADVCLKSAQPLDFITALKISAVELTH